MDIAGWITLGKCYFQLTSLVNSFYQAAAIGPAKVSRIHATCGNDDRGRIATMQKGEDKA